MPTISIKNFRAEIYWATTFFNGNIPVGGAYLSFGIFGTEQQKKSAPLSFQQRKIKAFVSGCCLFGDDLTALDQHGNTHVLTDPRYQLPADSILEIICLEARKHPYEQLNQSMLLNLMPLITTLASLEKAKILFHLPAPEYLLYGLGTYVKGQMTAAALKSYVEIILQKRNWIRSSLAGLQAVGNVVIEPSSPLDGLDLEVWIDEIIGMEEKPSEEILLQQLIEKLVAGVSGNIWQHACKAKPPNTLLEINYLSYVVMVAFAAHHHPLETCVVDMFDEKPLAREYTKIFAELCGPILGIHWLPPVLVKDDEKNSLYFCGKAKTALKEKVKPSTVLECGLHLARWMKQHEADLPSPPARHTEVKLHKIAGLLFSVDTSPRYPNEVEGASCSGVVACTLG